MKELRLSNLDLSDIKFKVSKFPDGQQTIELLDYHYCNNSEKVIIISRLNSFIDLELIICATQALKNIGFFHIELSITYFLGARSDRQFVEGGINYLKQVICPIINSQGYEKVYVFDPHSDVIEACVNNIQKNNNHDLVRLSIDCIKGKRGKNKDLLVVAPDAGAIKKTYEVCKKLELQNVIIASKIREMISGNIVKTEIPKIDNNIKKIIIIDDICDGGRTFVNLAKEIKKQTDKPIYLIVSHGIFSAGFDELLSVIDEIYTTNSFKDIEHQKIKQFKII